MKVIVTGCNGLIGTAVAAHLKKNHEVYGFDLMLGDDFTDEKHVQRVFKRCKAHALVNLFGLNDHVNGNRAGVGLFDISLESFGEYLTTNLTALFSVCREYARNNKNGSIINFSSTYGITAPRHKKHIGYSVSKAGVVMLTKHLASELAPAIRVNCIAPGGVKNSQGAEFTRWYGKHTPMGRMMDVTELNGLVEYLCTDASSYVTGAVFSCDGGWTAW